MKLPGLLLKAKVAKRSLLGEAVFLGVKLEEAYEEATSQLASEPA